METLFQDLGYGLRMLRQHPGFTAIAVMSLALGIGVNSALFSLINGMLLKPLPVKAPDEIVVLYRNHNSSYPDYADYRDRSEVFSGLAAHSPLPLSFSSGDQAERIYGEIVSNNYFSVLGVETVAGRAFLPEEDQTPQTHPVAMLSSDFWRRRFGSDPNIIGKTVSLNGHSFTVVGVAAEGFKGTLPIFSPDIWVPTMMQAQVMPGTDMLTQRGNRWLEVIGRLKPGISLKQAQAGINTLTNQLAQAYPETNKEEKVSILPIGNGDPAMRRDLFPVAGVLMAMVGLVLLIACANVANLLLARASARQREIAVRLALGASRLRLIRQLLTESILLALCGGAVAMLAAFWTNSLFTTLKPPIGLPIGLSLNLDRRVFGFTLLLSLLTGIVFGLVPALQASKVDLVPVLKGEAKTAGRSRHRFTFRNLLVIAQVAISLVLLIAAGLLVRSLQKAQTINMGFNPNNVLTMSVNLNLHGYTKSQGQTFFRQLVEQVETVPGVRAASLVREVPLSIIGDEGEGKKNVVIEGQETKTENGQLRAGERRVDHTIVGPQYFSALEIAFSRGRDFTAQDREGAPGVVIINETMARRFWPSADPIGKRLSLSGANGPYLEVIGVVKDSKYRTLGEDPRPYLYLPFLQNYQSEMTLLARTATDPQSTADVVRREVRKLDPNLAVFNIKTLSEQVSNALFFSRLAAGLFSICGLIGLLLAVGGVYGVINYSVSRRTQEIGIRIALGAQPRDVLKLVVGQGLFLTLTGVVIGMAGAFAVTQIMASVLYGVSATDPLTFLVIPILMAGVALLACYIPARKAAKVDPMVALRYE